MLAQKLHSAGIMATVRTPGQVLGLEGGRYGCTVGTRVLEHPDRFIARQQWGIEEELPEKGLVCMTRTTGKARS